MSESAALETPPPDAGARRYVGVQFRRAAALVHDFDAGDLALAHDARVVVETDKGEALGWTVGEPQAREPQVIDGAPVRRILRVANDHDLDREESHVEKEREARRFCALRARQLGLAMKVIAVEWAHSNEKATFYFASEERVDFRSLVRELAQRFRLRVEMRQVGPRDEAKIIGALGPCGRETCCSSWMRAFTPVSIKMAKDQGLALNPQKVTGVCGRLLCCLAYEQETYKELRKGLPKIGKEVQTPRGPGRIIDVLTLRRRVKVDVAGDWMDFAPDELTALGQPGAEPARPATPPADEKPLRPRSHDERPPAQARPPEAQRRPEGKLPRERRPEGRPPPNHPTTQASTPATKPDQSAPGPQQRSRPPRRPLRGKGEPKDGN